MVIVWITQCYYPHYTKEILEGTEKLSTLLDRVHHARSGTPGTRHNPFPYAAYVIADTNKYVCPRGLQEIA